LADDWVKDGKIVEESASQHSTDYLGDWSWRYELAK
jgi:hypothetical protein